jgi:putative flippase GtrA
MVSHSISIQFLRFGLVGLVNTVIDFGVLNGLMLLLDRPAGIALLGCNAVAFLCANLNSYFGNRHWTFAGHRSASVAEFGVFLLIALVGLLINSSVLWWLTGGAPDTYLQLNIAKAVATGVSMGWNFLGYRLLLTR